MKNSYSTRWLRALKPLKNFTPVSFVKRHAGISSIPQPTPSCVAIHTAARVSSSFVERDDNATSSPRACKRKRGKIASIEWDPWIHPWVLLVNLSDCPSPILVFARCGARYFRACLRKLWMQLTRSCSMLRGRGRSIEFGKKFVSKGI